MTRNGDSERILAAIDESPAARAVVSTAIRMVGQSAELHVVNVIGPVPATLSRDDGGLAARLDEAKAQVSAVVAAGVSEMLVDGLPVTTHLRIGDPASAILQLASDLDVAMVVMGTHGRKGLSRLVLGSVAESVLRQSECPVLVVRPEVYDAEVPKIEPPCPQCLQTRRESGGEELWCEQHLEHHGRRHTYHYRSSLSDDRSSSFLIPRFR